MCYARRMPTAPMLAGLTLLCSRDLHKNAPDFALEIWNDLRCPSVRYLPVSTALQERSTQLCWPVCRRRRLHHGFCLRVVICYHAICWLFAAIAYYPTTHSVRRMVEDENFAQTWYVFWVLPLVFIALNLFMIPKYADTLYTGRVCRGIL